MAGFRSFFLQSIGIFFPLFSFCNDKYVWVVLLFWGWGEPNNDCIRLIWMIKNKAYSWTWFYLVCLIPIRERKLIIGNKIWITIWEQKLMNVIGWLFRITIRERKLIIVIGYLIRVWGRRLITLIESLEIWLEYIDRFVAWKWMNLSRLSSLLIHVRCMQLLLWESLTLEYFF